MLQEIKQLILQNLKVKVAVHPAINLGGKTSSLSSHAPPNHNRSTFELNCSLYLPIIKPLSWLFPHPFASIWPKVIDLSQSDHTTLFQSSRVQFLWAWAKFKHALRCLAKRRGHLVFTTAFIWPFLRWEQIVLGERCWLIMLVRYLVTWTAFSVLLLKRRWTVWQILEEESFF